MSVLDRAAVGLSAAVAFVPKLVAAIVLLIIGYVVAKVIGGLVRRSLQAMKLDDRIVQSDVGSAVERVTSSPARLVGKVAYWAVMALAIVLAVSVLDITVLNNAINAIFGYVPNLIAAALILGVAGAISAGAVAAVTRLMGSTPTGKIAATAIPAVTMTIAAFMALNQLQIAQDIVNITFTALIGSVALGMALAFGLGGRDVASRLLEDAYSAGQEHVKQAQSDLALARQRATMVASDMAEQVQESPQTEGDATLDTDQLTESPGAWQSAFGETLNPGEEASPETAKKKASRRKKS